MKLVHVFTTLALFLAASIQAKLKEGECEVCINVVKQFEKAGAEAKASSMDDFNNVIKNTCKNLKNKENRFCYYIGATEDAATKIINEVSKPLSFSLPPEKICEKLKPKDASICELQYEKQLDWANINLKKMKVKELKKILGDWGETCKGCLEKGDFIKKIEEVKPLYVKEEL